MKTIFYSLITLLILLPVAQNAQNSNSNELLEKYTYKMQLNDVVIVGSDYVVYKLLKPQTKNNASILQIDTLKAGSKFKLIDASISVEKDFATDKNVENIFLTIELEDGSTRRILHPENIHSQCYKEGESSIPVKIHALLTDMLSYKETSFWYTFLICLTVALLYLFQIKRVDRLFDKLLKKKRKIYNPGYAFYVASGVLGAISGILIFFADDQFKQFFMYFPVFSFPSSQSWVVQYYWSLQIIIPLLFFWGIYRNITEFGIKLGLIRSFLLLIAGLAFFWTGVTVSLIAIGLLVLRIGSAMASSMANKNSVRVYDQQEYNIATGETKKVRVTVNEDGDRSAKYID